MNAEIVERTSASDMPVGGDLWFRRRLLEQIAHLRDCEIVFHDALGETRIGIPAADPAATLRAHVKVHDPEFYRILALGGSVGAGEAFRDGLWTCDELVALVRIFVRNRDLLDDMETGLARLGGALLRAYHSLRRNTRSGARRNISEHYDLGNDLFRLFLDDNLMYSSAVYADPDESLDVASTRKLERICEKLDLEPGQRVIEIGTGWGGFAMHAARHHGVHVVTTTISQEQRDLAVQRIDAAGLADRIDVVMQDFRDLRGSYDRLVSIEMVEAIGPKLLDRYFGQLSDLLKPDGLALVQAITIEDHRYQQALESVDFIKRHIFPGCFIPSISAMLASLARTSNLRLTHLEDIGPSYALTLAEWRRRFNAAHPEVLALGYPERFVRLWNYYLAYCEGGFRERSIGDVQMLFAKPGNRRPQFLPDLGPASCIA